MMNNPLCQFLASSIGKKIIVALTGAALVLFLAGHLTGNLLLYVGPDDFNEYAAFLHEVGHGAGIWVARIGPPRLYHCPCTRHHRPRYRKQKS